MKKFPKIFIYLVLTLLVISCFSVNYDFKGGVSIDPKIKTVSVQYFDNRATLVEPTLSQIFTEELKTYIQNNTNLRLVTGRGDVDFSGFIKTYETTPQAITGEAAAKYRFTIGVNVEYNNSINDDDSFKKSFSYFKDFDQSSSFATVEAELSEEIRDELIEQIFNAAFVNW